MMNVLASKDEKAKVEKLAKTSAPKRPEELNGEIFTLNYKKEKLFVAIGFWSDKSPYEVFCGKNQDGQIKNDTGLIVKNGRGKYIFKTEKAEHYLNNGHSDENADVVCRMLSASLRHGCDISFLVHQLEKTEGDLTCFAKVLARTLKRYIKDGTEVQGEDCPICNGKFVRQEGCCVCVSCGYSKCS
jgi:ribonucleoside-diphosphate reductase alpha chain